VGARALCYGFLDKGACSATSIEPLFGYVVHGFKKEIYGFLMEIVVVGDGLADVSVVC
jgi:hypothetical protein